MASTHMTAGGIRWLQFTYAATLAVVVGITYTVGTLAYASDLDDILGPKQNQSQKKKKIGSNKKHAKGKNNAPVSKSTHGRTNAQNSLTELRSSAIRNPNSVNVWMEYGDKCQELAKLVEAMSVYKYALKLAPDNPTIHNRIGMIYFKNGDVETAKSSFKRGLEFDPTHFNCLFNLAYIYTNYHKDREKAGEVISKFIELYPSSDEVTWMKKYLQAQTNSAVEPLTVSESDIDEENEVETDAETRTPETKTVPDKKISQTESKSKPSTQTFESSIEETTNKASERFIEHSDGRIEDTANNKIWYQTTEHAAKWSNANGSCSSSGYRLPTIEEYANLVDFTSMKENMSGIFWSSSIKEKGDWTNGDNYFTVSFELGKITGTFGGYAKNNSYYFVCVK